jgi:hypothetical protein
MQGTAVPFRAGVRIFAAAQQMVPGGVGAAYGPVSPDTGRSFAFNVTAGAVSRLVNVTAGGLGPGFLLSIVGESSTLDLSGF